MLQKHTYVTAADRSGAGWIQVFHIYRGSTHRHARLGDFVKGAVKVVAFYPTFVRGKTYRPLRLGYVVRGLVAQTRHPSRFFDNTRCWFAANAITLLRRRGLFRSKAPQGPLCRAQRRQRYEALYPAYV